MSNESLNYNPKAPDMTVRDIIAECEYRGLRIIHTRDPKFVGQSDVFGFKITEGFVVRDDLDECPMPPAMSWFYSPYDAINGIETLHEILPECHPRTTATHEFYRMMHAKRHFARIWTAILRAQKVCRESRELDENPREEVLSIIDTLLQTLHEGMPK
jgi:hypothetical protein